MMPYEFLEPLFGTPAEGEAPKAMTYAELEAAIDGAENLNIVNLSAGGYVSQADYDDVNGKLETASTQLKDYDPEWKQKVDDATAQADARVAATIKRYAIKSAVATAGTVDPQVVAMLINNENVQVDGDEVTGISEQIENLRKEKPYLFTDNGGKPYITGPLGNTHQTGNTEQARVDARYSNNPWYRK